MASPLEERGRSAGLAPILLVAFCAVVALQITSSGPAPRHLSRTSASAAAAFHHTSTRTDASTTTITAPPTRPARTTTSPTVPPPPAPAAPSTTVTTVPPEPAPAPAPTLASTATAAAPTPGAVPPRGEASVWGCTAALAYLEAFAYPGFTFECPGNALGHAGMTCLNEPGVCVGQAVIAISDPCPAAYMNEASNSWVLEGKSTAPIDPYGTC